LFSSHGLILVDVCERGRKIRQKPLEKIGLSEEARNSSQDLDPIWVDDIRRRLISWYGESGRDLPWRLAPDPYRILVSEMMLVQTTVAAVIPYFERFLKKFPNVNALAAAEEVEVLKAWEGLGYYRRARQLQAAARMIVEVHGGEMPCDAAALRNLPGVGRYVAGAILSFAFNLPVPILEANSQRVLARLVAWPGDLKASSSQTRLWEAAGRLVPVEGSSAFNQALMDLGALVCTSRQPRCLGCPLVSRCAARASGLQDALPVVTPKPPPLAVKEACALVMHQGQVLVLQRDGDGLWANFWEFPTINIEGANPAGRRRGSHVDLCKGVEHLTGIQSRIGTEIKKLTYTVTNHRVDLRVYLAQRLSGQPKPGPGFVDTRWQDPLALADLPLGSASRRLAHWITRDQAWLAWR
jgi:A/G-specific adenine glycosylase